MSQDLNTLYQNSLKILAMAAEGYLKTQDDLSKSFVAPQIQAALQNLGTLIASGANTDSSPDKPEKTEAKED